jgi:hypothetical protein
MVLSALLATFCNFISRSVRALSSRAQEGFLAQRHDSYGSTSVSKSNAFCPAPSVRPLSSPPPDAVLKLSSRPGKRLCKRLKRGSLRRVSSEGWGTSPAGRGSPSSQAAREGEKGSASSTSSPKGSARGGARDCGARDWGDGVAGTAATACPASAFFYHVPHWGRAGEP